MSWLWPIAVGVTFFDVWSIFHFVFWMTATSFVWAVRVPKWRAFLSSLVVAVGWEVFETTAFMKWPHIWEHPESWLNQWVSDPLTCPAGFFLAWALLDAYSGRKR